jgi:hypothetical protein
MSAKQIIEKFGGQSALADLLGKGQSTVSYWAKTGVIPAKWHGILIELGKKHGIALGATDFIIEATNVRSSEAGNDDGNDYQQEDVRSTSVAPADVLKNSELQASLVDKASNTSDFLFYAAENGSVKVQVLLRDETVWASQRGMGEIFGVEANTVNYHLKEIFSSGELIEQSVLRIIRVTASDNKTYDTNFYNLDAIISVGYRVNSYQATQFRKWATAVLKSYLIKGFVLDDDRLKQGSRLFGKDYFDELLERIREIRASERRFYQKITDIYAQCSIDYDKDSPITKQFYSRIQDKLHYAIHGHTSAELIKIRADASKPNMGLYSYENEKTGGKVTKRDVTAGKNYLKEEEIDNLNRLVSMYLDYAEGFARRQIPMKMKDWAEKLDGFLRFNEYPVLENFGNTTRDAAEQRAFAEYEKFRVVQDQKFKSDFDKIVDEVKTKKRIPKA